MRTNYALGLLLLLGVGSAAQAQTTPAAVSPNPTALAATATGGPAGPALAAAPPATAAEVEAYVRSATKGGEMDFDKILAAKKQTMFLHDGAMYNKREYALVLWGLRAKALGVTSAERACAVYAQASSRPLSPADKRALISGFDSGTAE